MPTCEVCGDTEFRCENGLYFCTTCSTQSQHLVEEEYDAFEGVLGGLGAAREIKKRTKETRPKDKHGEKDRPWMLVEGFTILLREQVSSLVKLGANPQLKDVVLRLWSLYMKKSGLGFHPVSTNLDPEREGPPPKRAKTLANIRARDKFTNLGANTKFSIRSQLEFKKMGKGKTSKNQQEHQAMMAAFGEEEFYEEDNPLVLGERDLSVMDMVLEQEEKDQNDIQGSQMMSYKKLWAKHYKNIEVMSVKNTLALCYLGLLYVGAVVTPGDLVRWIVSGYLPYTNAPEIFPDDMKLNETDWNIFCRAGIPDVHMLKQNTAAMANYLDILPIPRMNIKSLIARYVLELRLPGDLFVFVSDIFDAAPPNFESSQRHFKVILPDYSCVAMCYIIIGLKILFRLDDRREMQLSEMREKMIQILNGKSALDLFAWMPWLKYQVSRLFKDQRVTDDWKEQQRITSTHDVLRRYTAYVNTKKQFQGSGRGLKSAANNISHMFSKLAENLLPGQSSDSPSSHRTSNQADTELEDIEQLLMDSETRETTSNSDSPEECDFSSQSLLHIIDWDEFLTYVRTGGISDLTLRQSCLDRDSWDEEFRDDQTFQDSAQLVARRAAQTRLLPGQEHLIDDLTAVSDQFGGDSLQDYILYQYNKVECIPANHKSYRWLLQVAARITGGSTAVIHNHVQRTELVLLKDPSILDKSTNLTRRRFKQKYYQ